MRVVVRHGTPCFSRTAREQLLAGGKDVGRDPGVRHEIGDPHLFCFVQLSLENAMPRFRVCWEARLEGTCIVEVDRDEGDTIDSLKSEAEEKATQLVEDELNGNSRGEFDVSNIDVTTDDVELCVCKECGGRKYKIDVLEGGAGLLKVGPCPSCQMIPNTKEVCEHVLQLLKDIPIEEEE